MYDLAITGATIVDGTGSPSFAGDIGISGGRIVAVGKLDGSAQRTISADGAIVTPGFIDLHTHYDGQVSWDPELTPSSLHGVTTAVMGNCGVGFAPVRAGDRDTLIRLMEGVEDIPGSALSEGIAWRWETFPEYMDAMEKTPHVIDFALQVPHDALRVYVMGERAVAGEAATAEDIDKMRRVLREALERGAAGFSTGRTDNHRSADGKNTPAAEATHAELAGLGSALLGLRHGVLQMVSDFDIARGPSAFDAEFDFVETFVRAAGGHRASVSLLQRDGASEQWERILGRAANANAQGLPIHVQVASRAIGVLLGLQATFHPFIGFPSYKAIQHLPLAERVAKMADPAFKAKLLTEKPEPLAGDGSAVPPLADTLLANLDFVAMRLFRIGREPNYEPDIQDSLYGESLRTGAPLLSLLYDALLGDEGKDLLYFPLFNYTGRNLDVVEQMIGHPLALLGLSDGGAHVGTVCDAGFPTFMMTHWVRDKKKMTIESVVSKMTQKQANYLGLTDRGTIAVGQRADLNVIDLARLHAGRPEMRCDLPAGGRRLIQEATGYVATLVAGQVVRDGNGLTGKTPGTLVRFS